MANVSASRRANADLQSILSFLRREAGQRTAEAYRRKFDSRFERLADHPESGSPRPEVGRDVRLVLVEPYVVLHRYDRVTDTIFILRVLHGRRRLSLDAS